MRAFLHLLAALDRRDVEVLVIFGTSLSAWITGIQMRRKIKKELGRNATDADLSSIDTWMRVEEAEREKPQ